VVGPGTNEVYDVLLACVHLIGYCCLQLKILHHRCCPQPLVCGPTEATDPTASEGKQLKMDMLASQAVLHVENLQRAEACNIYVKETHSQAVFLLACTSMDILHAPTVCMQEAVGPFGIRFTTQSQQPRLSYNIRDRSSRASLSLKGYEAPILVRYRTIWSR